MNGWHLEDKLYEGRIRVVTDDESRDLVALVNIGMGGSTKNAHLIAAAPRMHGEILRARAAFATILNNSKEQHTKDFAEDWFEHLGAILHDVEGS